MGEKFKITQETMASADTYITIATKELIASTMARACVKPTYMIHSFEEKDETYYDGAYGLAPAYGESPSSKARVMMTILNVYYLHIWQDDRPLMCSQDEYDACDGAHILNQIERMKSGEYREKAFDILADYREMEKYLNSAIYSVLRELNDPVKRFMEAIGAIGSIDGIQAALDSIQESKEGIAAENERQERIIHGEDEGSDESD